MNSIFTQLLSSRSDKNMVSPYKNKYSPLYQIVTQKKKTNFEPLKFPSKSHKKILILNLQASYLLKYYVSSSP